MKVTTWFKGLRTYGLATFTLAGGVYLGVQSGSAALLLAYVPLAISVLGIVVGGKGWASLPDVLRAWRGGQ
jgi:hypothetical protein